MMGRLKLAALAALLIVVPVLLVGCGGAGREATSIDFWGPFGGGDGEAMQRLVDQFNRSQSEVKVRFLVIPWGDYYTKLRISIVAASAPDVAICHASKLAQLAETGNLEDLATLGAEEGLDWRDFSPVPLRAGQYRGRQYAVPLDTHAYVMYYNLDILRRAGVLPRDSDRLSFPRGKDSLLEYLRKIKEQCPEIFPFGAESKGAIPQFWIWYSLYNQFEQAPPYLGEERALFDNQYGLAALELMSQLNRENLWPYGISNSIDLFRNGKTAIMVEGVWALAQLDGQTSFDFRVVPFPRLFERQASWGDSHTLIVPVQKDRRRQMAAMKFIDWLTAHSAAWAGAGHIPARLSVVGSPEFRRLPFRAGYAAAADYVVPMPECADLTVVNDEISRDIGEMLNHGQPPAGVLSKMAEDVDRILQF
ncbi:MAG: ABC transporter substrate-binding protein [Negativicutes bacterium]|nr:ABC transporter substrate-binding protein [Negativicutes bacterium]